MIKWCQNRGTRALPAAGVLIYWHVEKESLAIHSQLINCTTSEVAAMIEGAMRHGTTTDEPTTRTRTASRKSGSASRAAELRPATEYQADQQGQAVRPVVGEPDAYPQLTRPIRWELITQQYDQIIN